MPTRCTKCLGSFVSNVAVCIHCFVATPTIEQLQQVEARLTEAKRLLWEEPA